MAITYFGSENYRDPEIIESLVTYLTLIVFILRSYVEELKWCINSEWTTRESCSYAVTELAVSELHQRLHACVRAGGGHFEHMLW